MSVKNCLVVFRWRWLYRRVIFPVLWNQLKWHPFPFRQITLNWFFIDFTTPSLAIIQWVIDSPVYHVIFWKHVFSKKLWTVAFYERVTEKKKLMWNPDFNSYLYIYFGICRIVDLHVKFLLFLFCYIFRLCLFPFTLVNSRSICIICWIIYDIYIL